MDDTQKLGALDDLFFQSARFSCLRFFNWQNDHAACTRNSHRCVKLRSFAPQIPTTPRYPVYKWPPCSGYRWIRPSWMNSADGGKSSSSSCSDRCLPSPQRAGCGPSCYFCPGAKWGLFEHERMERELAALLEREVDLVSRRAIESSSNALLRSAILRGAVPVYVSR